MNKNVKIEKRIVKKYGVTPAELQNMSIKKIKNLKNINSAKLAETKKFKLVRNTGKTLAKGGALGASIGGAINTVFPNLIPAVSSALTATSEMSTAGKVFGIALAASKPVELISGPVILGISAGVGAILYGGYTLIKSGVKRMIIANDRKKAKMLCK